MKGGGLYISKQIIDNEKKKEITEKKEQEKRAKARERKRIQSIIDKNPSGKPPPLPWERVGNFPDPNKVDSKKGSKKKSKKGSKRKYKKVLKKKSKRRSKRV